MAQSRVIAIALSLSSALLLVACGDSDTPSTNGTTSPAATSDATVAWANAVCTASTQLQTSVQSAGEAIRSGASSAGTSPDSVKDQVKDSVAEVKDSAANLTRTVSGLPGGVEPQTAQAQEQLLTAGKQAQDSADQVSAAGDQVQAAKTAEEVTASVAALKTAADKAATDLTGYFDAVRGVITGSAEAVKYAFEAAPACRPLIAPASPTPSPSA
ncbi:hypothetical protein [Actinoplanes sp. NPDC026623]|uniref:hypothetical protein n=1 Tax=Actinoplanes sp. NPDC026623 TaxID=3155610 RepID=UPI00340E36DA